MSFIKYIVLSLIVSFIDYGGKWNLCFSLICFNLPTFISVFKFINTAIKTIALPNLNGTYVLLPEL